MTASQWQHWLSAPRDVEVPFWGHPWKEPMRGMLERGRYTPFVWNAGRRDELLALDITHWHPLPNGEGETPTTDQVRAP